MALQEAKNPVEQAITIAQGELKRMIALQEAKNSLEQSIKGAQGELKPRPRAGSPPGARLTPPAYSGPVAKVFSDRLPRLSETRRNVPFKRVVPIRTPFLTKHPKPNRNEALVEAEAIREQLRKPDSDKKYNPIDLLILLENFNAITTLLPEDERGDLGLSLRDKLLAKLCKGPPAPGWLDAYLILAAQFGGGAVEHDLSRVLRVSDSALAGWENPGQKSSGGNEVVYAYSFVATVLNDPSVKLTNAQWINLLKYPLCVGDLKQIVLARLAEQLGRTKEPFPNEWALVSWVESHDVALISVLREPPSLPPPPDPPGGKLRGALAQQPSPGNPVH